MEMDKWKSCLKYHKMGNKEQLLHSKLNIQERILCIFDYTAQASVDIT